MRLASIAAWILGLLWLGAQSAGTAAPPVSGAGAPSVPSSDAARYSFDQHRGSNILEPSVRKPRTDAFTDSDGRKMLLVDLLQQAPLIVVPGYFRCSNLCGVVRASLLRRLGAAGLSPGRDYVLAVFSIDSTESVEDADTAKARDLAEFGQAGASAHWHYLTGSSAATGSLAAKLGFRYRYDAATAQFLHPAGVVVVTPRGDISGYLEGVSYRPSALRSAVEQAGVGVIARAAAPILLLCFHFDAATGRYSLEVMKVLRLAALVTAAGLAMMLFLLRRRERPV